MSAHLKVNACRRAIGLLGLALSGTAVALRYPDIPRPNRVFQAVVPADPLGAELLRCQKLGPEAAGNPSCEEAFAESEANFFSLPKKFAER